MSDCCRNPDVGKSGPYDPSEVRLYGRPATDCTKVDVPEDPSPDEGTDCTDKSKSAPSVNISLQYCHKTMCLPIAIGLPWRGYGDGCQGYLKSIGVIYGYAYEGHCYKMPKPVIMLLPEMPKPIAWDDCGCDCGYSPALGYHVWQLDKRQSAVTLDVRTDDLQALVLDENMPGSRSPQAYSHSMSLAPMRARE
ncbi:hypothetical protein AS026_32715 [Rhizobium altiplani]|uniref:Uncharacterized protein n=1 Tax=Rhizobium altiplani TaxID=1864509 RepID=A0A109JXN8_9HYPH|nr:hypothetical protein [Rhizobium altiplani]KWV56973.1 hypothetical protein AS026_32715 [Rhizobium altiplani]